ncbi:BrnT family toxin [Oceanibaculum pacificum]|uniref:BrnT family toxin n=1 Tax=Oceanibaculum pacificum TaxID=580166 RepID=A0A154W8Y4_9PROT|nr:BrnT family toxin [Oceanibaculum pacificum]KZD09987.1 hypothetical protein AUP43_06320 [Oceanibaculum pacificum]
MEFEWDDAKRYSNIEKHGIDFIAAKDVFLSFTLIVETSYRRLGERRFLAIGPLEGIFVVVVFTERGQVRRLISARRASDYEERLYNQALQAW